MPVTICSILGALCAFTGLAVFLISLIALLPVNLYNAIVSCFALKKAFGAMDTSILPLLFFTSTLVVALVSIGLFYMMTSKSKGKTEEQHSGYGSTGGGTLDYNTNTKPSMIAKHRHRVVNIYSISYVLIDVVWLVAGVGLLYVISALEKEQESSDDLEYFHRVVRSETYIVQINLVVMASSAFLMGISSLFFMLGKNKHDESAPLFSIP